MIEQLPDALAIHPFIALAPVWEMLRQGGVFMIPLAITSIAGLMAIVYKALSLGSKRVLPPALERDVADIEKQLEGARAEAILREIHEGKSVLARLGAVALRHRGKAHAEIARSVESASRVESVHLHAGVGVLDTVITIAPLLGLLGTASGLVVIFSGLGETTDHVTIARGISEALATTIFGLAIAVPCVVAQGYFLRRIETLTARLESLLADMVSVCEKYEPVD